MLKGVSDQPSPNPSLDSSSQDEGHGLKLVPQNSRLKQRFPYVMGVYAILAILAGFTLVGDIRLATLVFLGGLALKTYLAVLKDRAD